MGRRARVEFAAVKSSLVNLPLSLYGPLLERQVRPQQLAVHLALVDQPRTRDGASRKVETYVGWTGMPAASSLARVGGGDMETIEMDPLFASIVGLHRGDVLEIGLVHDMAKAASVTAEPYDPDDWDIIELHASQLENTLLSQARVVSVGQPLVAWVHGRTPVKLRIADVSSGDNRSNASALLGTDTEFIVAPKLRKGTSTTKVKQERSTNEQQSTTSTPGIKRRVAILRVVSSPIYQRGDSSAVRGYVSRETFVRLTQYPRSDLVVTAPEDAKPSTDAMTNTFTTTTDVHFCPCTHKKMEPPQDPTAPAKEPEPERKDPLSLALAQDSEAKEKEKSGEEAPSILLSCVPDAQVRYTTYDDAGNEEAGLPIWAAYVDDESIAFPSSCLGEGGKLSLSLGDWVMITIEISGLAVQKVTEEMRLSLGVEDAKLLELAGVQEELNRGHKYILAKFVIHRQKSERLIRGASGVLIEGNSGSGKTSVAKAIAYMSNKDPRCYAYTHYVDCQPLSDKTIAQLKALFQYWFDMAAYHRPSVIILDNLDKLLPAEQEQAPSFRSRQLAALFLMIFGKQERGIRIDCRGVAIIATTRSANTLHSKIRASHIFQEEIKLGRMTKDGRRNLLNLAIRERIESSQGSLTTEDLNLAAVAATTEGYAPSDLKDLVGRAIQQTAMRLSKSDVFENPANITFEDFEKAGDGFTPISLRDVPLHKSEVSWGDIGGLVEARAILRETLEWPTKYAPIFAQSPLRLRSGLLLYGYPGCGKTLLASAVAKECGLNFISVKGPELLNKYIGASEASVRDLFERASAARPCVLFFDEFDSIAPKRGHDSTGVTDRVVNQMLTQMDGAEGLEGVYVLAATSRPDLIDSALLRPGRLDKAVFCNMPSEDDRRDIFQALSRKVTLAGSIDLNGLAKETDGYSGADLQALLYNAHLEVVHETIAAIQSDGTRPQKRGEEDRKIDYVEIGAGAGKHNRSRAEEAELQKRLRMIMSSRSKDSKSLVPRSDYAAATPAKHVVDSRHLEKVLRTTKPSVSAVERERLRRIYAEFVGDRTGSMPVPPENAGVGQRVSLM